MNVIKWNPSIRAPELVCDAHEWFRSSIVMILSSIHHSIFAVILSISYCFHSIFSKPNFSKITRSSEYIKSEINPIRKFIKLKILSSNLRNLSSIKWNGNGTRTKEFLYSFIEIARNRVVKAWFDRSMKVQNLDSVT